ncbi:hypothetical protein KUH32_13615 [Thalassococcus sp. CAU 1522]|uniref:Histidine phosphotransferase ChpT C-terminal domain-containing protein n=1 Tax=Thalassococcus arenae TaxID=2851652 RepID=A0ABS6N9X3_9RHOB|nr:histidine phosphotransferase family protein [Thalassococcus arenae]MBV2360800.1 hypothetical protein [Thalassococcus arenae]
MQDNRAELAAMVGSRLCHDLISPVGAIQNGLELLALAGQTGPGPEIALIEESCAAATARIRFFRVAFGLAGNGQNLSAREAAALLDKITDGGRVMADWRPRDPMPRADVQMAFLAFLCCEAALPQGGRITVDTDGDVIDVEATGPRVNVDHSVWSHLSGPAKAADLAPASVQFALLATLSRDRGAMLTTRTSDSALQIRIG